MLRAQQPMLLRKLQTKRLMLRKKFKMLKTRLRRQPTKLLRLMQHKN